MFQVESYKGNMEEKYQLLLKQLEALIADETDQIANLANAAALLHHFLEDVNWVGFYLLKENQLVLGPFNGLPACVRIPMGKGVCGTAASERKTLLVPNVHQFPGHIACDAASQSEIVIPIEKDGALLGVLDIDSPSLERFNEIDQKYLESFVRVLSKYI